MSLTDPERARIDAQAALDRAHIEAQTEQTIQQIKAQLRGHNLACDAFHPDPKVAARALGQAMYVPILMAHGMTEEEAIRVLDTPVEKDVLPAVAEGVAMLDAEEETQVLYNGHGFPILARRNAAEPWSAVGESDVPADLVRDLLKASTPDHYASPGWNTPASAVQHALLLSEGERSRRAKVRREVVAAVLFVAFLAGLGAFIMALTGGVV